MQTGTAIVVLDVVYALCPAVVLAHDDANWIARNPNYTAPTGRHCCGPGDCYRIFADLVYEDGDGITLLPTQQKFRRGTKGTYLSEPDDWWMCQLRKLPTLPNPPAICRFDPFHSQ